MRSERGRKHVHARSGSGSSGRRSKRSRKNNVHGKPTSLRFVWSISGTAN